jgi:hypothetical protein
MTLPAENHCPGCNQVLGPAKIACKAHWRMVPKDIRDLWRDVARMTVGEATELRNVIVELLTLKRTLNAKQKLWRPIHA